MGRHVGYEAEAQAFRKNFDSIKNKKIVLYGIGRYTATLFPQLPDYNIIGFMDRDPAKIGEIIYGLPILSKKQAEKEADIIIINTVEAYWNTIFARIQDIRIPVFFRNGQQAIEIKQNETHDKCWETSYQRIRNLADGYDIISFDVFDTLISRSVYMPKDVWDIEEEWLKYRWNTGKNFKFLREKAASLTKKENIGLTEIYETLAGLENWRRSEAEEAKKIEYILEERLIYPREKMVSLCKELIKQGKEIYFLSDMYLPEEWFQVVFKKIGVECKKEQLWISCSKKASKVKGDLWKKYKEIVVKDRKALHIGDNKITDVENARQNGIDAYQIFSGKDLLEISSMREIVPFICSKTASKIMGLIIRKMLNDPFSLNQHHGKINFDNPEDFGYCVYGPVILSFLIWLLHKAKEDKIEKLLFVARDGYFLVEDYKYLIHEVLRENSFPEAEYLLISRRVAMIASTKTEEDLREVLRFPFSGTFKEYMKIRFGMEMSYNDVEMKDQFISLPNDENKVLTWIEPYKDKIWELISSDRSNYERYLKSCNLCDNTAVVDTWYYGNTQYYLNKILKKKICGYYFAADLSENNRCFVANRMIACFQSMTDLRAEKSELFKKALITESFLTAPYGMIQKVNADGSYSCSEQRENQKHFHIKHKINEGVKSFIKDFCRDIPDKTLSQIEPDTLFVDRLFGCWFSNGCEIEKIIKDSFWSDNDMVQKREFQIFD